MIVPDYLIETILVGDDIDNQPAAERGLAQIAVDQDHAGATIGGHLR